MAKLQSKFDALHIKDLSLSSANEVKEACALILEAESLTAAAVDTLDAAACSEPLFDGDVPSKSGRDELVDLGLVARIIVRAQEGYNACTQKGYWALKILRAKD